MGLQIPRDISVDFSNCRYIILNAKQYDSRSRFIRITCTNLGQKVHLTPDNYSAFIRYRKPDGYSVFNKCIISTDGKIIFELTEQMLSTVGTSYADLVIIDIVKSDINNDTTIISADGKIIENNNSLVSTMNFYINVLERPLDDEDIISTNEFSALNELLNKANKDYEYIVTTTREYMDNAHQSETNAKQSEDNAKQSEINSKVSEDNAKQSEINSADNADLSQSYAVGGTGIRDGEDVDNSRYYKEQAAISETNAGNSANTAITKANEAATSAETSLKNATDASNPASSAKENANKAESFLHGGTGIRENEDTDNSKYYYEQTKDVADNANIITSYKTEYQQSISGTNIPDDEWSTDIPEVKQGTYLWTRITFTFTNRQTSVNYSVAYSGIDGSGSSGGSASSLEQIICDNDGNVILDSDENKLSAWGQRHVVGVKGNAEKEYRDGNVNITAENVGALPLDGVADSSLSVINSFNIRPTSLNIDFSNPDFQNRLTYMLATSAANDSGTKPFGLDAWILNLAWDSLKWGCQVGFTNGTAAIPYSRGFLRASNEKGVWESWIELLTTANYSSEICRINNQLTLDQGSYVSKQSGTVGTAGYVNFARIKVITSYANYPCVFVLGGRGRTIPMFVCVDFTSYNGTDPTLAGFYKLLCDSYEVYICKTATSQWDLYAPKNEAYGRVDILDMWYSSGHFQITLPNTHVAASSTSWIMASMYGSNYIKDKYNGVPSYLSYSTTALSPANAQWLAMWHSHDGIYELKTTNVNNFIQAKMLNGYYGMAVNNYLDNQWIRTTSQGLIPYQQGVVGSGHCSLGSSSWSFAKAYIDKIVTRSINFNDALPVIEIFDDEDGANYGCELVITGGGNTFIGSGESPRSLRATLQSGSSMGESYDKTEEELYISSDNNIYIYTNCQTIENRTGLVFDASGVLSPIGNDEINIGRISHKFNEIYANRLRKVSYIDFDGSPHVSIRTIGTTLKVYSSGSSETDTSFPAAFNILCPPVTNAQYPVIYPDNNGHGMIGNSNYKWNQFFATNGAIQTSDKNEKKEISYIGTPTAYDTSMSDETLVKFVRGLGAVVYKRKNGESGRPHHGFIAQDVEALMQELGIKDHVAFIKSPKTRTVKYTEEQEVEKEITDEETGETKKITVTEPVEMEKQEEVPGEYIYGLRYEEFIADIVRFVQLQDGKIEEQEEKINKQQEELDSQRAEINDLKARLERLEALVA